VTPRTERVGTAPVPTRWGTFIAHGYRNPDTGDEHLALVAGRVDDGAPVLVRVHSECLTGDVLGSTRCDCGAQLDAAMRRIAREGRGVLVYLTGHEGRGIGLAAKIRAYALQDDGLDTVDANVALGEPVDARRYDDAAAILRDLGVGRIVLMTNNPAKRDGLVALGTTVVGVEPLATEPTAQNDGYLRAKRDRLGHRLHPDDPGRAAPFDLP
jgi:3,4-dihydroxy 2-butanone 4-phosphate synthase/GTP cyclohydrolase II